MFRKNETPSPLRGEVWDEGAATSPLPLGGGKTQLPPLPQGEGQGEGGLKGGKFSPDQLAWLNKIKDQIAQNAEMTVDDFEYTPFNQEGGLLKARELFGKELEPLINELNGYLIA